MDDDPTGVSIIPNREGTILDEENHIGSNLGTIIFALCVNFLMYVVLIIVFYMLTRFYLEEETEWHTSWHSSPRQRKLRGHSEALEEDTESGDAKGETSETKDLLGIVGADKTVTSISSDGNTSGASTVGTRARSFLNINEWGEPEGTKQEVVQRVIWCAVGLCVSFGILGLVQERMLTMPYEGEYFVYSYGLVFVNRLGGIVLSFCLMRYYNHQWVPSPLWEYCFPSVSNMLSSWCQYEALKYVTFPTQMLFKAFKIVPTMLMGYFMHEKHYEGYEYVVASTIGFGVYIFVNSSENIDFTQNVLGDPDGVTGTWCGIALLLLFLGFDSFTGQWQSRMFTINHKMDSLQMMFITNFFSSAFSFVTLVHQGELETTMTFFYNHPTFAGHAVVFCLCSTVGQLFIYYTIQKFGAVVFSIIMAFRILLSVILSCVVYEHTINDLGYIGIMIVFAAISYRIHKKSEGQPLIRWRNDAATETKTTVFREWHEHLDM